MKTTVFQIVSFSACGPDTSSFNGLHRESNFLATNKQPKLPGGRGITEIICCIIGLGAIPLLPLIREAYGRNLVNETVAGTLETVEQDIGDPVRCAPVARSPFEIFSEYQSPPEETLAFPDISAETDSGGIGRNEPCPCGSGKKFKKCCMR